MIKVKQITEAQKNALVGQTYDGVQFMNPPQDINGNWYISKEVYNSITLVRANELGVISWWFTLPEIDFNPVISEFI
jgi:hypothetical protein